MAAYAGTTTIILTTVFGNKRVSLVKIAVTNYNSTGIPLFPQVAAVGVIDAVLPFVTGLLEDSDAPLQAAYIPGSKVVRLYSAADTEVADDTNLDGLGIYVYLVVIGS